MPAYAYTLLALGVEKEFLIKSINYYVKGIKKNICGCCYARSFGSVLCSCEAVGSNASKDDVKKNLPEADYDKEEKNGDDKVTNYFKDKLCGFTFTVTSEKKGTQHIDAVTDGYEEKTSDNRKEAYYEYIKDTISDKANEIAAENGFAYT